MVATHTGPLAWYQDFSQRTDFESDPGQLEAVHRLQQLHDELMEFKRYRQTLLARTFGNRQPPRGLYLYGSVGRGKSALMDGFFSTLPYRRKRRVHFHEFMATVHERLRHLKNREDPLKSVAAEIAVQTRVLCFDEFHVSDIADAMILNRLFEYMINWGVVMVMTSNYAPSELYPGGLQRDRFLPAIRLLESRLDSLNVSGDLDHRLRSQEILESYFTPLGRSSELRMEEAFRSFCPTPSNLRSVEVLGREIAVRGLGNGVAWFDFAELCEGPRSQRDYLELVRDYYVILVSNVPALAPKDQEAARRFTWLVDILYDQRVKLLISAETDAQALYPAGVLSGEFARTVSRLLEMQSAEYQASFKTPLSEESL